MCEAPVAPRRPVVRSPPHWTAPLRPGCIPLLTFALTLVLRVHGISRHFAMLGDQIRDWGIALGPFSELPLVGPATHVGGYTIGPAFYWILWAHPGHRRSLVRQPAACAAASARRSCSRPPTRCCWSRSGDGRARSGSPWRPSSCIATAPYDLALAALVWNPMMGCGACQDRDGARAPRLAVSFPDRRRGHRCRGLERGALLHGRDLHHARCLHGDSRRLCFRGEHARSGAERRGHRARRRGAAGTDRHLSDVARAPGPAMGAVTGSVGRILSGQARPDFARSWNGFSGAFTFIQGAPWHQRGWLVWILAACAIIVARDIAATRRSWR